MSAPSKKNHCLTDLQSRILSQAIAPGSDLEEAALAETYGISRTPLREVLQRLAGEGYITLKENRGAKVASMDLAVLRTFFQTAPLVYANIARLAAENRRSADLEGLKDIQRRFAQASAKGQASDAAILNHQFHACLGQMAQNPYLEAALGRMLIDHTRLSQTFYRPQTSAERALVAKASEQHDAMISAVEAREPTLAVDLTLQHWALSKDQLERYVQPDPLPLDVVTLKDHRDAV